LIIDLEKLRQNLETLSAAVHGSGCSLAIVTKACCADSKITEMLLQSKAVDYLADSRIANLKTYSGKGKETMLLRLPQACEIADTLRYADISLNSEIETIRLLDEEAQRQRKTHKVILMIDLGDLREGVFFKDEDAIFCVIEEIQKLANIEFAGIGTNLSCYGAVIPKKDNLSVLSGFSKAIEEKLNIKPAIVSGGNTSSYYLIERGELPAGINNLRLGESFVLGNDTSNSIPIPGTHNDAVLLEAQIIELKTKPSYPVGEIGVNAFGEKPAFQDRGMMRRAILAIGKQDTDPENLIPLDNTIEVLGSSSDHTILDLSKSSNRYKVGDTVKFRLNYSAFLRSFTSAYVQRHYTGDMR
jgi:predicted amino acid racemase